MAMIAKDNGGADIPKLEGGVYTAISTAIIDLGLQANEKFDKTQRKFMLIWNIQGEEIELNGEKMPRQISKEYSFSLHEKSGLRKDLQAWRGKPFTEEELQGFNLLNILNVACQLQIILEEKNQKQYNNIAGIMSLPKGTTLDTSTNETYHFDIENVETWTNWNKISKWVQEKIKKATNYENSGLKKYVEEYEATAKEVAEKESNQDLDTPSDDLPF